MTVVALDGSGITYVNTTIISPAYHPVFQISNKDNKPVATVPYGGETVELHTDHGPVVLHRDGTVDLPENLPLSDAARAFWTAVRLLARW